jgi:hypothetical protein
VIADRNPTMFRAAEALAEAHQQMRAEGSPIAAVVGPKREPLGLLEDSEAYPEPGWHDTVRQPSSVTATSSPMSTTA